LYRKRADRRHCQTIYRLKWRLEDAKLCKACILRCQSSTSSRVRKDSIVIIARIWLVHPGRSSKRGHRSQVTGGLWEVQEDHLTVKANLRPQDGRNATPHWHLYDWLCVQMIVFDDYSSCFSYYLFRHNTNPK
jgi:hypothetical protein